MSQRQSRRAFQPAKPNPTAMNLNVLDRWLRRMQPEGKIDNVSMLDGYVTAIVVGPVSIPPDEWFTDLLGSKGRIASAHGKTLAAIEAIIQRHNAISDILATAPQNYAPIFQRGDDGTVFAEPWCLGFLTAMHLRWADWKPLRDPVRPEFCLTSPIFFHCSDPVAATLHSVEQESSNANPDLREIYHAIPIVVPAIREFWMLHRFASP
ncbi:MAG: hypothetical protein B7Z57_14185 [Acidiphilium sp. 37-60-79]|nr:MAG: hypothetical protein B7Z57_14185 [Acidiphilium sp. 37-60-79]